ncbi:MAG: germination protein YpeB, partial [Clostridia bacterium]|nr:germination protein YpeB [Clostridia bacterium]
VRHIGETEGAIPSYLFSVGEGSLEVSKVGGYIVECSTPYTEGEYTATVEQVINTATVFLSYIGYNDMKAVWVSENSGLVYINFAYEKDGVIYYPDLIKVKISLTESKIIGLEAQNYLYNHVERAPLPEVKPDAEIEVKEGFEVSSKRLAVIPTEWNTEIVAYEVAGSYQDSKYYIYYDAKTLEEIKVMRVINDENQGELIV